MTAVVVAYVPTPVGRAALTHGIAEAQRRGARLVVVNTSRGDALVDERYVQGEALTALQDELAGLPVETDLRHLSQGRDIADELDAVVTEVGAELLVIGLRKRSQVGKLIMGSAATRILVTVGCPILCVKRE